MSSSYSPDLRIELIGTGDQAGVWGATTNNNLAYVLEQSIAGYVSVSVTTANQAFTYINGGSSVAADNQSVHASLALTTTTTADFAVYAPPASKQYTIYNASSYVATIYNSTVIGNTTAAGTGVAIPAGKTMTVWSDGTNFAQQNTHLTSPSFTTPALGTPASGTLTNATGLPLTTGVTGILPVANGGTGVTTSTGTGNTVLSNSPTLVTPALGTPASATLTNATGLPLTTGVIETLPVANGGTGSATLTANNVLLGNGTSALQAVAPGSSGNVLTSNGTTWQSTAPSNYYVGARGQVFTSSGTFTVPTGVTAVKVTVVGGGGNGGGAGASAGAGGGGGGGIAIKYVTGLTAGGTVTVTVGGVAGTSSFGAYCSATGGASASTIGGSTSGAGGAGGTGSSGDLNITGTSGASGYFLSNCSGIFYNGGPGGAANGSQNSVGGIAPGTGVVQTLGQVPSSGMFGGGGFASSNATGYGNGGGGRTGSGAATSGTGGIVIVEW